MRCVPPGHKQAVEGRRELDWAGFNSSLVHNDGISADRRITSAHGARIMTLHSTDTSLAGREISSVAVLLTYDAARHHKTELDALIDVNKRDERERNEMKNRCKKQKLQNA